MQFLNNALKGELTAINQYFLHARMLKDWGVAKLADHEYKESIEEMKHAEKSIDRILFLEGMPNLHELGKLWIGENVEEVFDGDMKLEEAGIKNYREGIKYCNEVGDYVTRDLFAAILTEEEDHVDFIETQRDMIKQMGLQNYIMLNSDPGNVAGEN